MIPYYALPIATLISLVVTIILLFGPLKKRMQDVPNERSLHVRAVPRSGGIALLFGIAGGWGWLLLVKHTFPSPLLYIILAILAVAGISLFDDLYGLSVRVRLPVHLIAAVLVLLGGVSLPWGWVGWIVSLFGIIWMLNLFNFMDGMDGFAGGMAMFGFAFLGYASWLAHEFFYAYLCWTVTASALSFLIFNFPPARIFMGDTGSVSLGLMAAALSLWGYKLFIYPIWFPLLVFSPFIIDASVTLIKRGVCGRRVWLAHREHYYQRLVQSGWSHRQTVLIEYTLMMLAGLTAIWVLKHSGWRLVVLASWSVIYTILILLAERLSRVR